ncbi:MAG: hypothetical protein R3E95_06495 [Thiolinea sp.]
MNLPDETADQDSADPSGAALDFNRMASLKHWGEPPEAIACKLQQETVIDCGWGRLIFGRPFSPIPVLPSCCAVNSWAT